MKSLRYARGVSLLRGAASMLYIEEASRAVCAAYKAARGTTSGEDSPPPCKEDTHISNRPPPPPVLPTTDQNEQLFERTDDNSDKPSDYQSEDKDMRLLSQHGDNKSERLSEQGGGDNDGDDMVRIPPRPQPRVPTAKVLRLLLGVLKRNPAGVIKDAGVQLMLLASGIEVAKSCPPPSSSVGIPRRSNGGADIKQHSSNVDKLRLSNGRSTHLEKRKQRDKCGELERQSEATAVLTLARRAAERRAESLAKKIGGGNNMQGEETTAAAAERKKTMKRFCKLRTTAKVEDALQDWAAKRGRNVSGFVKLLGLFGEIKPGDAKLVLDRVVRIPAGEAAKALPEAGLVQKFIYDAVVAVVGEPDADADVAGSAQRERPKHVGKAGEGESGPSKQESTLHDRSRYPGPFPVAETAVASKGSPCTKDPLGEIPLVTEQGERNLWDDILDEQLSKCRPFVFSKQRSSTGTANGHTFTGDVSEDDSEYSRSRAGVESRRRTTDGRRKEETSDTVPQEKKSKERAGTVAAPSKQSPRLPTVAWRGRTAGVAAPSTSSAGPIRTSTTTTTTTTSGKPEVGGSAGRSKDTCRRHLRPAWRGTEIEMAAATTPEALAKNDGLVDRVLARVRRLWLRDPYFAEAGDASAWDWATVGGVGRSDRARINERKAGAGGGETAGIDLSKTQMISGHQWGATVVGSKLRNEWCAEKHEGTIDDSPAVQCAGDSQEAVRGDRNYCAQPREDVRKWRAPVRRKRGWLSSRSGSRRAGGDFSRRFLGDEFERDDWDGRI